MSLVQTRMVADKASLSDLRRSLRHDLAAAGASDPVAFDCLIAVSEMWSRSADQPLEPPAVRWDITASEARFYIEGCGTKETCMASHPSRAMPLDLSAGALDDLSISLVTALMDKVDVVDGPSGRTFCLTKSL